MQRTARPSTAPMSWLNLWMKWLWWTWLWMVTALQSHLTQWCQDHNCALSVNIPWSRSWISGGPIDVDRAPVELVSNFKFLGVTITEDLRWSKHTNSKVRKAHLWMLHWQHPAVLLYRLVQKLQHRSTQWGRQSAWGEVSFPSFQEKCKLGRSAESNTSDTHHPNHNLFQARENSQPGKHYKCVPSRIQDSYFPPALRLLNKLWPV